MLTTDDLDSIANLINQSEDRLDQKIKGRFEEFEAIFDLRFQKAESNLDYKLTNLSREIGQFIEDTILPLITEKADKSDVDWLDRRLIKLESEKIILPN